MNRSASIDPRAGFTLIEMLVVVALLGLIVGALAAGVRLGINAWSSVERQAQNNDELLSVAAMLRRTIATAAPSFANTNPTDFTVVFDGEPGDLVLVGPWPGSTGLGPWARLHLFVAAHDRSHALYLSWEPDEPRSDAPSDTARTSLLLDHVAALKFDYFGVAEPEAGAMWSDTWTGRSRLPDLVRISISRDDPALRRWPDLVVAPRADVNATCRYDAVRGGCSKAP